MIRKVMCSNPRDIQKAHKHIIQVHLCILQWFMDKQMRLSRWTSAMSD